MVLTSTLPASPSPDTSIDAKEASHFGKMAAEWWDPKGSSAMLHKLNPPRLTYIRAAIDRHWDGDDTSFTPLAGKRALDVGCGAGLLAEPLARLGASVTGVDAAAENVAVAAAHAAEAGLAIDYRAGSAEAVEGEFDLVTCLEVIEHVAAPARFVAGLAARLAPGGLLVMSTPNRTPMSRLAMIGVAEGFGLIPRGTHDWHKFLTPDELTGLLQDAGLTVTDVTGLGFSPATGFALSQSTALDYFVTAVRSTPSS